MPVSKIVSKYSDVSRAKIYHHVKKKSFSETSKTKKKMVRPTKVTECDRRKIVRSLLHLRGTETEVNFTSQRIRLDAGLTHMALRTVRRVINQEGYFHLQSRKKGLMSIKDKKQRVAHLLTKR